jgi:hypothetical protein
MTPSWEEVGLSNGVGQVLYNYRKWMPRVGIEFVDEGWDVLVSHLGSTVDCDVHHNHGLWLGKVGGLQKSQNRTIINSALCAKHVIVPSNYVANYFRRDMRLQPHVVGHGVNAKEWEPDINRKYILWNKNRMSDVCDPTPVHELASRFPNIDFLTTFSKRSMRNIVVTGTLKFEVMKRFIRSANVYLATTKETFGIGTLEAMACGVPVLGFRWGGTADIVTHGVDGYLAEPENYDDLAYGLSWILGNRNSLSEAAIDKARQYTWLKVVTQLRDIYAS